jgi:hypothetical protein
MRPIIVTRSIRAPVDVVFRTIADIGQFSQAVPHIVKVEFLSAVRSGVGTRFRETRLMHGKEATTDLEVTEYMENERIRLVADSHGAVWDTLFTVKAAGEFTELTMAMESKPYRLLARIMNTLVRGMISKAVEQDMDAVKAFCEKG